MDLENGLYRLMGWDGLGWVSVLGCWERAQHLAPGSKSVYPTSPRGVGGEGNHAGLKRGKEKNGTRRSQSWDEWGVEIGRGR